MRWFRQLLLPILLVSNMPVLASGSALNESKALQLMFSRDIIKQRMAGEIALGQSKVMQAEKWPNPELSFSQQTWEKDNVTEESFGIEQKIDFSGRRGLYTDAAELELQASRAGAKGWRIQMEADTRQRFYTALYQQQRQAVYQQTRDKITAINRAMARRNRDGDVSSYDYQRAKNERAKLQAEAVMSNSQTHTAWQQLRVLTGDSIKLFERLEGELLPMSPKPLTELLPKLEQQPALQQRQQEVQAFHLQQRAAEKFFPEVTLGVGVRREEANGVSDEGVMFSASIPIPLFDTDQDKQMFYRAKAMMAQTDYQLARDKTAATLQSVWQQCQDFRTSAIEYRQDATKDSKRLIKLAEAYYRAGRVGILELLDAYRGALEAELTALELEYKARTARIELDSLMGGREQ